jgi:hypothetical protein
LPNRSSANTNLLQLPEDYRPRQHAMVWQTAPADWREQLALTIQRGMGSQPPTIFFRADDIGAGGRAFEAMCRLFRHHQVPLGMAVVPAWLSSVRKRQLFEAAPLEEPLWGWHQHGWRHVNWQRAGKKSEFTPPWNRLSNSTLRILQELGFRGVSMNGPFPRGVKPSIGLRNLRIQLDLHTRRAKNGHSDFHDMLDELKTLMGKKDPWGIMIHHQRMTTFAFQFLDELLGVLKNQARANFLCFKEILEKENEK